MTKEKPWLVSYEKKYITGKLSGNVYHTAKDFKYCNNAKLFVMQKTHEDKNGIFQINEYAITTLDKNDNIFVLERGE